MPDMWLYGGAVLCALLLGTVFFGAPYVPTRRHDVDELFEIIAPHDVLMDLGSGDGRLVKSAAQRGIKAYGVELSPLLVVISRLRLYRWRRRAQIKFGNYWRRHLPDDTTVVFVFLTSSYMSKLKVYLEAEAARLARPLTLVSYGFELPGYAMITRRNALLVYRIEP